MKIIIIEDSEGNPVAFDAALFCYCVATRRDGKDLTEIYLSGNNFSQVIEVKQTVDQICEFLGKVDPR